MIKQDYYYLFGEEAATIHERNGLDALIEYIKGGGICSLYHYKTSYNTPNDLLYEYDGFFAYIELDKLEYDILQKITIEL